MPQPVSRLGRLLDVVGVLAFLLGAGLYGRAWLGLRRLREVQPVAESAREMAAMARYVHFSEMSRWGGWVMVAGGVIGVMAAVVAWLRSR